MEPSFDTEIRSHRSSVNKKKPEDHLAVPKIIYSGGIKSQIPHSVSESESEEQHSSLDHSINEKEGEKPKLPSKFNNSSSFSGQK